MNTEEFVETLKSIPLQEDINRYKEKGLDDDFISEYFNSFVFEHTNNALTSNSDPLVGLVTNYKGDSVIIGMISFDVEPEAKADYFIFGRFEMDLMVINNKTSEIEQREHGMESHVLGVAAANGESFMGALLEVARFFNARVLDDGLWEDYDATNAVALKCSEVAGGVKYLGFYKMMLGI